MHSRSNWKCWRASFYVLYKIVPDSESTVEHLDNLDKDISVLTASLTGQSSDIQKLMEIIEQKKLELEELIASKSTNFSTPLHRLKGSRRRT